MAVMEEPTVQTLTAVTKTLRWREFPNSGTRSPYVTSTTTLSEPYLTSTLISDTLAQFLPYSAEPYDTVIDPNQPAANAFMTGALWDLWSGEDIFYCTKVRYGFEVNPGEAGQMQWLEVFRPQDNPDTAEDESQNPTVVAVRSWQAAPGATASPIFEIDPSQQNLGNGSYDLLPFELNSDLNNDGKVGEGSDSGLKTAAIEDTASDDAKEKASEYLFVNDQLSNGLWDDEDPAAPADKKDDDDLTELKTICTTTWGAIWFEYEGGDIAKLAFYKAKECTTANKMTFPFALSETNKLPEKLYVRAEGEWTAQVEGKLLMKFGNADKSETYATDKLRFTVVKDLGDKRYFHAARDYIMENNARFFAHEKKYDDDTSFRIISMREEGSVMYPIDAARRPGGGVLNGIDAVAAAFPVNVAINGNMCFFSVDYYNSTLGKAEATARGLITDKCHGRIVRDKIWDQLVSSDNENGSTSPAGSLLAGETYGRYIAQYDQQKRFVLAGGRVPLATAPDQIAGNPGGAMGGLSTNYNADERNDREYQAVGYAPVLEAGKGIVFTATQSNGTGKGPDLAADVKKSGVQALPGGGTNDIQLLLLDGGTSTALAYTKPDGVMETRVKKLKHTIGYFINTYLLFRCGQPRPTTP